MTPRERVLAALGHHEPDHVPIDLGGTESSSLTSVAYNRLRKHLGLPLGARVVDPYQHVVRLDDDVKARFDVATEMLVPEPCRWRRAELLDGTPCELPEGWHTRVLPDGTEETIGATGTVIARRAASGYHFDSVNPPLAAVERAADLAKHRHVIAGFDWPAFADESVEDLAERAKRLHQETDRAVVFNYQVHVLAAGQILMGYEAFMAHLVLEPRLAEAFLTELVDAYCERTDRIFPQLGDSIDVVLVNDDLGTQQGPMLSPDLYRRMIRPHQQRLFAAIKSHTRASLLLHSCGSVRYAIPDLIEIGVDALNPVQVSAAGMDSAELKREFGRDLTFWGGGCDTQHVLSRGSPDDVRREVRRRLADFSPGGGFVFAQVHNIQPEVPPENVVAMLEAAQTALRYHSRVRHNPSSGGTMTW
jgi:uroporphyrinogen decarboxylase